MSAKCPKCGREVWGDPGTFKVCNNCIDKERKQQKLLEEQVAMQREQQYLQRKQEMEKEKEKKAKSIANIKETITLELIKQTNEKSEYAKKRTNESVILCGGIMFEASIKQLPIFNFVADHIESLTLDEILLYKKSLNETSENTITFINEDLKGLILIQTDIMKYLIEHDRIVDNAIFISDLKDQEKKRGDTTIISDIEAEIINLKIHTIFNLNFKLANLKNPKYKLENDWYLIEIEQNFNNDDNGLISKTFSHLPILTLLSKQDIDIYLETSKNDLKLIPAAFDTIIFIENPKIESFFNNIILKKNEIIQGLNDDITNITKDGNEKLDKLIVEKKVEKKKKGKKKKLVTTVVLTLLILATFLIVRGVISS